MILPPGGALLLDMVETGATGRRCRPQGSAPAWRDCRRRHTFHRSAV